MLRHAVHHRGSKVSTQDIQNLYKLVNDLRVEVSKFIGAATADHEHLSEIVEEHIEKDDKWKDKMEAQVSAIANALLQDQTHDAAVKETKKEIGGIWYAVIVIVVTLLANLLPKWF